MNHIIINCPTVYACKLPNQGWVNLAQVRQIEYDDLSFSSTVAIVTWSNGDKQTFYKTDAKALIDGWNQATKQLQQRLEQRNPKQNNRRF